MFKLLDADFKRVQRKAMHGYSAAVQWECGVIAMTNETRPEMGTHFIFSGEALRNLAVYGYGALFILQRAVNAGCTLTICHIALDVFNGGYEPKQLSEDFYADRYEGRARNGSQASEKGRGFTAYVGAWKSDRFFRYYDKAAERNTVGDHKRLELILKGDYAKAFMWELGKDASLAHIEQVFKGTVKAMANMRDDRFQAFMAGNASKLTMPKHKENSTRAWLLTQVAGAIAGYIIETGDDGIIDALGEVITLKYQEKINSQKIG